MNTPEPTAMPHRLLETAEAIAALASASAAAGGGVIAFLRARWDGETIGRALILTGIAAGYCAIVCLIAMELWPHWSKVLVVAGSTSLGFSPKIALKRIDGIIGAFGSVVKKKIQ